MEPLRNYLNSLAPSDQTVFAEHCETSLGYLRKVLSTGGRLGESLCIRIERESRGVVRLESLRPDVDWEYLRNRPTTAPVEQGVAHA